MFRQKMCIVNAIICHKKAGEDACEHLECIKNTGCCLKGAGVKPPPFMVCIIESVSLYSLSMVFFWICLAVIDWQTDRLTDWLTDYWLNACLTDTRRANRLTDWIGDLTNWRTWLTDRLIDWLVSHLTRNDWLFRFQKKCLPIIPCCMLGSETCEEKLCCFVRFGECLKKLGDKKDAE